jgi:hypothetical protein
MGAILNKYTDTGMGIEDGYALSCEFDTVEHVQLWFR